MKGSASIDSLMQRLTLFGQNIPQEKVYVHMDNTCYFLGDTIWFKAYLRRTDKDIPSGLSRVLYAELYNQDGYLVQRKMIKMQHGEGYGNFALLDTLYGGYYELRAYTRWQLNWGQTQHPHSKRAEDWFFNKAMAREYYRDYDKLYSRVFPVYDKPKQEGEFFHDMTVRPLRRIYADNSDTARTVLSVYPEGGFLLEDVPCRLACEAITSKGEWLTGSFQIQDASKNIVAQSAIASRGRALLTFTPQHGQHYKVVYEGEKTQKRNLENILKEGAALQVQRNNDDYTISITTKGSVAAIPLGMTVMREGVVVQHETFTGNQSFTFSAANLQAGVHQVTLFDANGRVYADRLFFVTKPELMQSSLKFSGMKAQYKPFDAVSLTVEAPAEAANTHLSVSVRDAATADYTYDSGNLLTEMLLASEIRGFVPQPGWFFEADDAEHQEALDLLMLTQGWRRFNWKEMALPNAFNLLHPYEYTQVLSGVVHNYTASLKSDPVYDAVQKDLEDKFHLEGSDTQSPWDDEETEETTITIAEDTYEALRAEMKQNIAKESVYRANADMASGKFYQDEGHLKREVRVHAEFAQPGSSGVVGDVDTDKSRFRIQIPSFYENCVLFLGASDTAHWTKGKSHQWVMMDEEEYPEFYVRLSFPYPRFVKPYNFYQTELAQVPEDHFVSPDFDTEKVKQMRTLTVRAKNGGLRGFDANKPAFVIDAYEAFNEVADAGLCAGWYIGANNFFSEVARTYIGDMGMDLPYNVEPRYNSNNSSYYHSDAIINKYNFLYNLDKVYIYTDYSPRLEGDKRFDKDQPTITVDLRLYEDESRRVTYRDRRYILPGFAIPDDFYQPDYKNWTPSSTTPKDYRRTLYWNPDVVLDANGKAEIKFYNNAKETTLHIQAEGQTAKGQILTGAGE